MFFHCSIKIYRLVLLTIFHVGVSEAYIDGLYCGRYNCYDVLGVTRESTKQEIAKRYRLLAKQFHPDKHRDAVEKKIAEDTFKKLANAYEILKDDESRTDYDFMLDNPEQVYHHYYRYYSRSVTPKVDVRIVIATTISIVTIIQYYVSWKRYESAIKYLLTVPKYRNRAVDLAKEKGLLDFKRSKKSKSEIKEATDAVIKKVLEDNLDIRGGYAKPKLTDLLWLRIILFPYTIICYLVWYFGWIWKYNIRKQPYGDEQKLYLIRKNLSMSQEQFDALEDEEKEEYLTLELWETSNYEVWSKKKEEDMKKQMAESSKYKAYRRYLKNHGVGRMTFDDS